MSVISAEVTTSWGLLDVAVRESGEICCCVFVVFIMGCGDRESEPAAEAIPALFWLELTNVITLTEDGLDVSWAVSDFTACKYQSYQIRNHKLRLKKDRRAYTAV